MKKILILSLAVAIILQYLYYKGLPQIVAHTFGTGGLATAGILKTHYILLTSLAILSNSLICLMAEPVCARLPVRYISFPHKDYWLTEERKQASLKNMGRWTDFFGILVNTFLLFTFYLVFKANMAAPPRLNTTMFFSALGLFVLVTLIWIILLAIHFRPPRD